jgi:hypothetical protein
MDARRAAPIALLILVCAVGRGHAQETAPAGASAAPGTAALSGGATLLQTDAPADGLDIYLVGFHPLKDDPGHQVEAHHFCRQQNEDFVQCALFDGNGSEANLTGIEYIISERVFAMLPVEERGFWHPHNGEILSGQLVAPGLPDIAEKALMRQKMNSYGKTWHTWDTSQGAKLPLGPPALAWSFSRLGEADPAMVAYRDRRLAIDTEAKGRERQDLVELAHPQSGVDALAGKFGRPTQPIPGVSQIPTQP